MTEIYKQSSIPLDLRPLSLDQDDTFKIEMTESLNLTAEDPEFDLYSNRMNNARQARILEKSLIDDDEALYQEQWAKKIGQDMKVPGSIILGSDKAQVHDTLNFNQYTQNLNDSYTPYVSEDNIMQIPSTLTVKHQPKFESYKDPNISTLSFANPEANETSDEKFIDLNAPPRTIRLDRPEEDLKSHDETFKTTNEEIDKSNQIIVDKILGLEELNELFEETQDSELVRNQLFQLTRRLHRVELINRELNNELKGIKLLNYSLIGAFGIYVTYKCLTQPRYY